MNSTAQAREERKQVGAVRKFLGPGWAETGPDAADPALQGRRYGISFDRVWNQVLELITTRHRWTIMRADDEAGIIEVTVESLVFRFVDDVRIAITLDGDGQTRVDVRSASRRGKIDFRTNRRRVRRFLRHLDRSLSAT